MAKKQLRRTEPAQPAQRTRREVPQVTADPEQGLNLSQVKERQHHGWANDPVESPTKTVGQIVRENCCTFFNFIFIVLAALLIAVGSLDDLLFLLIALANTGIGIIQQLRSKQTVDKLNLLSAPRANVVREGNVMSIPAAQLVRDDVAELSSGEQIPADATVLSGQVQVNEALITGEADAIVKNPGDQLLSGSFVVAGRCRARLDRVGADSYAAKLTLEAKKDVTVGKSEMMSSLDKLIRIIGILLVPIGVALFVKEYFFLERTAQEAVVSMVAALIGMIPEGLYLLTSVALAVSMIRLAQGKVLAQDMNCIETLARVDVLCVDKTGTITEPHMEVGEVVYLDQEKYAETVVTETLNAFYKVMEADNDTGRAMQKKFHGTSTWHAAQTIPFTSAAKWSAAVFPGHGSFVVGAPEFIMGQRYADLKEQVEPWSAKGYRVLLVAEYDGVPDQQRGLDPRRVSPMALAMLANRVRPAAPKTFRYFAEQGVAVKVISGDNPVTVAEVARQAGIEGADKYVDAATLRSDSDIERAVRHYTVFGRVTPNQKRKLVRALQNQGHTVAMTGDGVNDVLALKDADCGIAMASGADAACHAAQLVLLNSDFSAMPKVVAEGRRVINNIQRAAALYLVKNIFSFCLAIISLFATVPYPVTPLQLSLLSAVTIGVPSFFLALEPNHSLVKGNFLANVFRSALPGGLADLIVVLGVEAFYLAFGFTTDELSTISAILLIVIGILVLYQVCKPFDWKRRVLWGAMAGSSAVTILFFGQNFGLSPLELQPFLVLLVFLGLSYSVFKLMLNLFELGSALLKRGKSLRGRRRKA
ncbi:cation-translocating P-type ATPase [Pseudoflavonifractor phocaeensis]|uniref:cation-translocating P-type ATPase n=1 Tax=Pseudoflavonifractor phocaeensis TaxID=1870988 RepID=UPI00195D658E|nr:cation-translocating P-type ATPase [Pseudoflavonifractor phocaeensis]MBM6721639.1 cation-translocating P-type ATPase [Pseudoflavonifractor phocaeensis]